MDLAFACRRTILESAWFCKLWLTNDLFQHGTHRFLHPQHEKSQMIFLQLTASNSKLLSFIDLTSLHKIRFSIRSCHQSGARKQGLESCVLKLTIRLLPDRGWRCLGRVIAFCINIYAIVWFEACHQPRFVGYETNCKAVSQRIDGSFDRDRS